MKTSRQALEEYKKRDHYGNAEWSEKPRMEHAFECGYRKGYEAALKEIGGATSSAPCQTSSRNREVKPCTT